MDGWRGPDTWNSALGSTLRSPFFPRLLGRWGGGAGNQNTYCFSQEGMLSNMTYFHPHALTWIAFMCGLLLPRCLQVEVGFSPLIDLEDPDA